MSALTHPTLTTRPAHRLRRLGAVGAAIGSALAFWAVVTQARGLDLRSPAFSATTNPAPVGAGLLAIVERTIRRPRRAWTIIGVAALIVSLGAPLYGHGVG